MCNAVILKLFHILIGFEVFLCCGTVPWVYGCLCKISYIRHYAEDAKISSMSTYTFRDLTPSQKLDTIERGPIAVEVVRVNRLTSITFHWSEWISPSCRETTLRFIISNLKWLYYMKRLHFTLLEGVEVGIVNIWNIFSMIIILR